MKEAFIMHNLSLVFYGHICTQEILFHLKINKYSSLRKITHSSLKFQCPLRRIIYTTHSKTFLYMIIYGSIIYHCVSL